MRIFGIAQNRIAIALGALGIAAAFACLAPNASASSMANMDLTSGGSDVWESSVYIGPYTATITQAGSTTGTVTSVICDDFADDSYTPETWTAYEGTVATLSMDQNLKWGDNSMLYGEMAYLATLLVNANSANAPAIQFAIWQLSDANGTLTNPTGVLAYLQDKLGNGTAAYLSFEGSVEWYMQQAANNWNSSPTDWANVAIYSYDTGAACPVAGNANASCPSAPPQEFLVVTTPEPSTLLMLGLGLGLGAMFLMWRRQRNAGSSSMTAA